MGSKVTRRVKPEMTFDQALSLAILTMRQALHQGEDAVCDLVSRPKRSLTAEEKQAVERWNQVQAAVLTLIAERSKLRQAAALRSVKRGISPAPIQSGGGQHGG